jgi:dihydroflavonol-4-reductase
MAWDFVETLPADSKFKLVTICPTMVLGPQLTNVLGDTNSTVHSIASGLYPGAPRLAWDVVDVRDVALYVLIFLNTNRF